MRLGRLTKAPDDRHRITIDYSQWLLEAEMVDEYTFDGNGLVGNSAEIAEDGKSLTFFISGGADGDVLKFIVTVGTDGGQVRQDFIIVTVTDPDE